MKGDRIQISALDALELQEARLMGRAPMDHQMRAWLAKGGVLLDRGVPGAKTVSNRSTGRKLPCCYGDCERVGDKRQRVSMAHNSPRVQGERLVYIFCGEKHRAYWLRDAGLS